MTRRKRIDTAAGAVEAFQAEMPQPPEHIKLPPDAWPCWVSIVGARDYTLWTAVDLEHAANLACCMADMERMRQEIRQEGDVVFNHRGTQIVNPKHNLLETLSRRSVALSRLLHVHAEATAGASRDEKARNKQSKTTQSIKNQDFDGLLATAH